MKTNTVKTLEEARHIIYRETLTRANEELGEPYLKQLLIELDNAIAETRKAFDTLKQYQQNQQPLSCRC